ncbi:hypothetical protein L9F63_010398 [Diploptera punctata]|uniref:Cation/H+ exchanger transmembrane domain-containing protein n=1 Tax=Diploptera punctata TaxID=6984 RepID=A0AAD8AI20_DIPPU|nr:hypothetical protein L9F63_010398 [Diploptera punctata]
MVWGIAYAELNELAKPHQLLFKIGLLGVSAYAAATFMELELSVLKVTTLPVAVEIVTVAVMTHYLLDLPWIWSFMLGSLLSAVSVAVPIPCLFRLKEEGNYGHSKGISTLVIAAASVIEVECVTIFGTLIAIAFSEGSIIGQILNGPICVVIGVLIGMLVGLFIRRFPGQKDAYVTILRTTLIGVACLFMMLGTAALGYDGAGPLGCFVIPYVASAGWTLQQKQNVERTFAFLWHFFQPLLFGLIGASINFHDIKGDIVGPGVGAISLSILMRTATCFVVLTGVKLNWKEKLFVCLTWCPKATIQAAFGPLALDKVKEMNKNEVIEYAHIVLILAVLAVLITAPLFDFLIIFSGTRLLEREELAEEEEEELRSSISSISVLTREPTTLDFFV